MKALFQINRARNFALNPKVAYLLGSGLSIPFGLPGVCELTDKMLTSDQFAVLHTDQCYHVGIPPAIYQPGDVTSQIATEFIRLVNSFLSRQTTVNRIPKPNYEDIADFIKQYHLSVTNEYENPALSLPYLHEIEDYALNNGVEVGRLLKYSIILIDCVLQHFLDSHYADLMNKMDLLQNVVPYPLLGSQLDIFTLNHDRLIEDFLTAKGLSYADGFYPNQDKLSYFDFSKFWQSSEQVRLVKLHGSIDRYYHNQSMIKVNDPRYINDPESNEFADNFVPSVLSGKIVKLLDYSKPIHADLYSYFRVKLATEISTMIVVGYGFGDKGINNALSSWFGLNANNRLIVVTREEDTLISNARFAMGRILADQRYRQNRGVVILDGGIESISSTSIRDALK